MGESRGMAISLFPCAYSLTPCEAPPHRSLGLLSTWCIPGRLDGCSGFSHRIQQGSFFNGIGCASLARQDTGGREGATQWDDVRATAQPRATFTWQHLMRVQRLPSGATMLFLFSGAVFICAVRSWGRRRKSKRQVTNGAQTPRAHERAGDPPPPQGSRRRRQNIKRKVTNCGEMLRAHERGRKHTPSLKDVGKERKSLLMSIVKFASGAAGTPNYPKRSLF